MSTQLMSVCVFRHVGFAGELFMHIQRNSCSPSFGLFSRHKCFYRKVLGLCMGPKVVMQVMQFIHVGGGG
jgi:hypothetical protein